MVLKETNGLETFHLFHSLLSKSSVPFKTVYQVKSFKTIAFFQDHWVLSKPFISWLLSRPLGSFKSIHQLTSFKTIYQLFSFKTIYHLSMKYAHFIHLCCNYACKCVHYTVNARITVWCGNYTVTKNMKDLYPLGWISGCLCGTDSASFGPKCNISHRATYWK